MDFWGKRGFHGTMDEKRKQFFSRISDWAFDQKKNLLPPLIVVTTRQIPLFDLFDSVVSRGGFAHVTMERIWHHVAFSLNLFPFASHCSAVLFELKKQYEIYLLEYELHLFRRGLPVSLPRADGTTMQDLKEQVSLSDEKSCSEIAAVALIPEDMTSSSLPPAKTRRIVRRDAEFENPQGVNLFDPEGIAYLCVSLECQAFPENIWALNKLLLLSVCPDDELLFVNCPALCDRLLDFIPHVENESQHCEIHRRSDSAAHHAKESLFHLKEFQLVIVPTIWTIIRNMALIHANRKFLFEHTRLRSFLTKFLSSDSHHTSFLILDIYMSFLTKNREVDRGIVSLVFEFFERGLSSVIGGSLGNTHINTEQVIPILQAISAFAVHSNLVEFLADTATFSESLMKLVCSLLVSFNHNVLVVALETICLIVSISEAARRRFAAPQFSLIDTLIRIIVREDFESHANSLRRTAAATLYQFHGFARQKVSSSLSSLFLACSSDADVAFYLAPCFVEADTDSEL